MAKIPPAPTLGNKPAPSVLGSSRPNVPSLSGVLQDLNSVLNLAQIGAKAEQNKVFGPWNSADNKGERNTQFPPIEIVGGRWDKLYPYRLLVVREAGEGEYEVQSAPSGFGGDTPSSKRVSVSLSDLGPGRQQISFEPVANNWEFRLPITPQSLTIGTKYAIDLAATLKGINEQHGGVRFKNIAISGTFGVWPFRPQLEKPPGNPNALQTLFGGTLQAFSNLTNQISRTINSITSNHPANAPTTITPDQTPASFAGTGYAQALLMDQFLEQYAEAKRNPANSKWRLAFDIPKQNQTFLITPISFEYFQSADYPNEYKYRFNMTAWKRINLKSKIQVTEEIGRAQITPNFLQRLLTAVREARKTLATAFNLVRAVRSDFQTPFNILRELALFVKDLAGLAVAIVDLPRQIIQDARDAIADIGATLDQARFQAASAKQKTKNILQSLSKSRKDREGLGTAAISAGQVGVGAQVALLTDPMNQVFANPDQNYEFFDLFTVEEVSTSVAISDAIDAEVERVRQLTVDDLIQRRGTLLEFALQVSNAFGTGDATYSIFA